MTSTPSPFLSIEEGIQHFRDGRLLILVDDEDRENEGDLIVAAEHVTPDIINFMITNGRGLVCMPIASSIAAQLSLPMMVRENRSREGTPFMVSIGSAKGITTGISPADRAHTVRTACAVNATPADIVSPGHIFPLCAKEAGVLKRRGHTEGCVDLAKLAGLRPAATLCEIIKPNGEMARLPYLEKFAQQHNIGLVTIDQLVKYRMKTEVLLQEEASAKLPLHHVGELTLKMFVDNVTHQQFVVLHANEIKKPPVVRIHSECFTGDLLGSMRCDCRSQLHTALHRVHDEKGILLYMPQEGRGIGLLNKIKAYALQDQGMDTVEANHELGLPSDSRDYAWCAQILKKLEVESVRLLTNNPLKIEGLEKYGIEVLERIPLEIPANEYNEKYLQTKRDKLGHFLNISKRE
ncbi:MAG: bifunctional 3,4-dihydroxy-2-butanone 4-phosphate synthase/GTP cyclohydrolase II [Gammaproteobacteria bacterium RIFCSPHIGHO2_12_FULL_41_15]|nr:MAG: bifunctional 3,4-dihydroxy-2-butanone 4-phosphate synthase/GTP cyclohydrolase II [Gammaproteobacteria bacterium RIFCSPHIGHO2_12_FULL_41_15]